MRILMASVAALAMAATPALAQPGKDKGNGNGGGKPAAAAKAERGNGGGNGGGGNGNSATKSDRGNGGGNDRVMAQSDRGNGNGNGNGNASVRAAAERDNGNGNGNAKAAVKADRGNGANDRGVVRQVERTIDRRGADYDRRGGEYVRRAADYRFGDVNRGLINGCPPGLAKKRNGCNPPGQVKDDGYYRSDWWGYDRYFGNNDYRYRDGYLVRYGDRGIASYIPLLGGALSIGNQWPSYYQPYEMPRYYNDFYGLNDPRGYRYADDVIYRVDPETSAITSIAALLTGDNFAVGQTMPMGYDVYNVPYGYRDRYYDSPDAYYRYSDGYIYQVDPETRLIAAAIELLV